MTNPLLETHKLPPFSAIKPEHIVPAVKHMTDANLKHLDELLESIDNPTWDNLLAKIEDDGDRLSQAWSPVSHLNYVCNTPELRDAHEEAIAILSPYWTALGQNQKLFDAYTAIRNSDAFSSLSQAQQTSIEHALRDFKLSGIGLPKDTQKRYGDIQAELSKLSSQVSNNVLDATQGWFYQTENEADLAGLPASVKSAAKTAAKSKEQTGYVLTLDVPVYMAVLTYADNRELRKTFYTAYNTRASDQGPTAGQWDNTELIEKTLKLRHELAQLLGFDNYSELSLATKMADTPDEVVTFLESMAKKVRPAAEKDLAELKAWVIETHGLADLEHWDVSYYSDKLKEAKYSVSSEEVRRYFTLPNVKKGLFDVARQLYGIEITENTSVDLWHSDAQFYDIHYHGKKIASFYTDLCTRENKRGGAWMDVCRSRRQTPQGLQLPVAYLVCNFNPPVDGNPSLLTHNDVTTLFHEFGHGLHHMMTQVDVAAVSGVNGVEWDAVELPSQFMENWAWQPEVLKNLSAHVETGEPLPDDLIEKMITAKNFQSGLFLARQLELGLFDMQLHKQYGADSFTSVQGLLDDIRARVAVIKPPAFNRFQNGFTHIFAGGYAAGYYSYLWAEVLSADAFAAFEETSLYDTATGERFLAEILSKGGSQNAATLFKKFRGREPDVAALLRHSGITADAA